ncbi:hypothetical protein BC952_0514 [Flavobacterium limicola]|jgi:hypothetical protein|uniref:Uncharacterized protein n=1 Tax=Flavobacterium limicola TaxID=180441 RepID=A0A495S4X3_9FLAO|nr:hypothetical protein BC952_0514 [Flavobacterium limicola]
MEFVLNNKPLKSENELVYNSANFKKSFAFIFIRLVKNTVLL